MAQGLKRFGPCFGSNTMAKKAPEHPPAFQFYANDFASSATVEAMSTKAVGAYVLLLCKAWHQDPVGTIPENDDILSKWARVSRREWENIKKSVLAAFELIDGRWHQERMKTEWQKLLTHRAERAESGANGAKKRWQKDSKRIAEPSVSHASANSYDMAKNGSSSSSSSSDIKTPIPPLGNGDGWELKEHDLRNTDRIIAWMRQTRFVEDTHANQLKVVAASERAFTVNKLGGEPPENRVAYFVSIVRDGNWKVITDADTDRAKLRHLTWQRQQVQAELPVDLENLFAGVE
jgi:uncharacterized protein YdaU (DUF1376 family)